MTGVAREHSVSISSLAARNNLRATDQLAVGQLIFIPGSKKELEKFETDYVVKPGDSLASIAQKFDVPVSALAKRNDIQNPNEIKVGQTLEVPSAGAPDDRGPAAELRRQLDRIRVDPKRWKRIIIHHSGTSLDTMSSMDRYHRNERNMENGLAYHFVVGNGIKTGNGAIYTGQRWKKQLNGGHLRSEMQNYNSIGICLIGNFDKAAPSEQQIKAVSALVTYLMGRCDISRKGVQTHRQINVRPTECPGSKFPMKKLLARLP